MATLTQRLAQNRLTEGDRLALATGDLTLLLPAAPQTHPSLPPDAAMPTVPAALDATPDAGSLPVSVPDTLTPPADLSALAPVAKGVTGEVS